MSAEDEIIRRFEMFKETNNRGYLVDVAKFALWTWVAHKEAIA